MKHNAITLITDLPKCRICEKYPRMLGQDICYPCADLRSLIKARPDIAKKILDTLDEIKEIYVIIR